MRVGIVADDLTGAMDAAASFADRGMPTRVLLKAGSAADPVEGSDASVLSIDTHTREAAPAHAASAVSAAMGRLSAAGMLLFKKIDSTLRGNVGAEIVAALTASGRHCALIAPAAPQQGRVLRDGWLFVNDQRVGDRPLADMLCSSVPGWEVRSLPAADCRQLPAAERRTLYVADAADESDLDRVAQLGLADARHVLLAGSSGLASAVARQVCAAGSAAADAQPTYQRLWFVVGSYSARSAEQVRTLVAQHPVCTVVLPLSGEVRVLAPKLKAATVGLVHVEGLGQPPALEAGHVAARLAQLTEDLLAEAPQEEIGLFMTGGDTARAILERFGAAAIDVYGSRYPGVVHGRAVVRGRAIGLMTKAGGFGTPDLFARAAADLLAKPIISVPQ